MLLDDYDDEDLANELALANNEGDEKHHPIDLGRNDFGSYLNWCVFRGCNKSWTTSIMQYSAWIGSVTAS